MNMNFNYLTTIYRSILTQIYVFLLVLFTLLHFDLKSSFAKIVNIYSVIETRHAVAELTTRAAKSPVRLCGCADSYVTSLVVFCF